MSSIFLSHSHRDKPFARRLSERLQSHGIRTWIDEAEMQVGDSLIAKIESAIKEFAYLGVILSPHSVSSEWVRKEVSIALTEEIQGRRVKVLPLLYSRCKVPGFLADKVYADFTESFDEGFEKLLARLQSDLHEQRHKQKRAWEILQAAYQDWVSFGKQDSHLLDRTKSTLILEYLAEPAFSSDLLAYILYSASHLIAYKLHEVYDFGKLSAWVRSVEKTDAIAMFDHLFGHPKPRVRQGAILLIERMEETRALVALAEFLPKEGDSEVRRAGVRCISHLQKHLPSELARYLVENDEDWVVQSYALHSLAGYRNCLLISDGSEFATELGELAQHAGFNLVSVPPTALLTTIDDLDTVLSIYELLILVRGEHFTGNEDFYSALRDYVGSGGRLFATSWTSWETRSQYEFASILPFKHIQASYMENIPISCQPTGEELSEQLFAGRISYHSSIELLQNREGSTLLLETDKGIPIFGYRPFGEGMCYYLNTCQHACLESMQSPLQSSSELRRSLQSVFAWVYNESRRHQ